MAPALALLVAGAISSTAAAQTATESSTQPETSQAVTIAKFLGGAAAALGLHEGGHVLFNVAFDAEPGIKGVSFGSVPFFAITHRPLPPARELVVSSAGFWVQHAASEMILSRRPALRNERAPYAKGVLAFNVLASGAYAVAAFARTGPAERDTRGMALSADVPEPAIGAFILVPAVLDAARYFNPQPRALKWASRAAKFAGVLLILRAAGR